MSSSQKRSSVVRTLLVAVSVFVTKSAAFSPRHTPNELTKDGAGEVTSFAVIQTKMGLIRGAVINTTGEEVRYAPRSTTRFLGLPYARPPTGEHRFRKPHKHPGWAFSGALQATEPRPACPQLSENHPVAVTMPGTSEDCLYLNIHVPTNLSSESHINALNLPVMVYLHGGHFQSGRAGEYPAWRLAGHGDVIVVEVQYRLGVLGFVSTLGEDAPGNMGLWDQQRALRWIWDNIREFGGDPEGITIFGEGAGGVSVGLHVLSPTSRGLFIRAISQDGTALSPGYLQRQPVAMATALGQINNCPIDNLSVMMECLRTLPLLTLMQTSRELLRNEAGGWYPTIDGDFLPDDPHVLMAEGRYSWVDYIVGVNNDAGYAIQKSHPVDFRQGISIDQFESVVRDNIERVYSHSHLTKNFDEVVASILHEYTFCGHDSAQLARLLMELFGDMHFIAPALQTASHMARSDRRVYFYTFSHPSTHESDVPDFVSAIPEDELRYLFGDKKNQDLVLSSEAQELSTAMKDAWTNFAKSGDPNPVNDRGVNWRRYSLSSGFLVDFRLPLDTSSNRLQTKPRRVAFWNHYLPHVLAEYQSSCSGQLAGQCATQLQTVQAEQNKTSLTLWIALGVCGVLAVVVAMLTIRQCIPDATRRCACQCCGSVEHRKTKYTSPTYLRASEMSTLRPLPYRDET